MNAMKKQDDGLFLTELLHSSRKPEEAEKRKKPHQEPLKTERTQRSDRPNDVKLRQVAAPQEKHINLSHFPSSYYTPIEPLAPGYGFYTWFVHQHAKLPCASPDTILVEPSSAVYYIFTHRDATTAKRITLTTSEDKESFVSFALERMLQPLLRKNIELSSSTVAVVKRPLARKTVANTTETISPLDLLAMLLDIADSNTGPLVLQQYIYPRGKNPTFCRIHWKNSTTSASGSSTAYLLTPTAPAKLGIVEEVEGEADGEVKSVHDMMSAFGKRRASVSDRHTEHDDHLPILPTRVAALAASASRSNAEYLMRLSKCALMTPMERASVHRHSSKCHKLVGSHNICSLSEEGVVTEASAAACTIAKITHRALNGLDSDLEQLIAHIEMISRLHSRNVSFADFIRDCQDKWWMIQVKGFRLSEESYASLLPTTRHGAGDFDFDDDVSSTDYLKNNTSEKFRLKLLNEMGHKCKMCGVSFVEGQTVGMSVDTEPTEIPEIKLKRQISNATDITTATHQSHPTSPSSMKRQLSNVTTATAGTYLTAPHESAENVQDPLSVHDASKPAFGYHLTHKMAVKLAEILRDGKFPLTSFVKELLVQHTLSNTTGITSELQPARPKSGSVYEKCCECEYTADNLYKSLGVGRGATEATSIAVDPTIANKNTVAIQKLAAAANELILSTSLIFQSSAQSNASISTTTHRVVHGKAEPWNSRHFDTNVVQWRLMILVHALLDVRCPDYHALAGNIGCLSYSLGQQVQSLPFRNVPASGLADSAVVPVRQCRLHYLFASHHDVTRLFADKEIEFHLFFSPDSNLSEELDKTHLTWEGSFTVQLRNLKWTPSTLGREKIDALVPVKTVSLGKVLVKLSVAIASSDEIPLSIENQPLYREKGCFWPPSSFHDAAPLPDAWIAMMTPQHATAGRDKLKHHPSQEEITAQDNKIFIQQLQSHIVRRGFDREKPFADGTVETAKILEIVLEDINNEIVYGEQQTNVNKDIINGLKMIRTAVEMMQEDEAMFPRLTWDALMSKLDDQISHIATKEEAEERVAQLGLSAEQLQLAKQAQENRQQDDFVPELTMMRSTSSAQRRTRRTQRLTSVLNALRSPDSKSGASTPQRSARLDPSTIDTNTRLLEYAMYASTTRRNRRLLFVLSIFEIVSKQCEAMDVAELRQYLFEEREKLNNVLKMVHVGLMTLPSIGISYEQSLSAKFSLLRSVICAHLLSSSQRLLQLYQQYEEKGVAIISQIAFVTSCEDMFRQISELTAVPRETSKQDSLRLDKCIVDLYDTSRSTFAAPAPSPGAPLYCRLLCDAHGVTDFFIADVCCVKCEMEIYRPSEEK